MIFNGKFSSGPGRAFAMNIHILPKDPPGNDSMPEYCDFSLNYDLQKCLKIVSKMGYPA